MPMTTRAQALSRKSDTAIQKLDSNLAPCVSASRQDDAHISSAIAPAPPCKPRTKGNVVPTISSEFPISVDISAAPPLSPTMVSSIHSSRAPKSGTSSKTSSSSTVRAQKLAAKVEYARRLAHIEAERENAQAERENAQAERQNAQAEREKALATLELQAELAAINCSSAQSSRSTYIQNWLETSQNKTISERNNQTNPTFREYRPLHGSKVMLEQSERVVPMPTSQNHVAIHTAPAAVVAMTSAGFERHSRSEPRWERGASAGHLENTAQTQLGTHHSHENINCHINKVSDITLLTQAIKSLKTPTGSKVSDLPIFTGSPTDWLYFHKMYERTRGHFDDIENLSRLSTALKGAAREAVASLLVASDDPKEVILALEQQFGNSELVVLKILAEVKALPRITNFDSGRELNVFACKVRNFVSTIQLLKYSEYLASPELANTILGKLSPLLREKWVDFAFHHSGSNRFKLELLTEFLVHEAYIHLKFGMITENFARDKGRQEKSHYVAAKDVAKPSQYSSSGQSLHTSSNPHSIDSSSNNFIPTKNSSCLYCKCQTHDIESCHKFLSMSVEHRLKWATDGKLCRRCLIKGGHKYAACKKSCKVETCKSRRHHTLLHRDDANNYNIQTETESDTSGQASAPLNTDSSSRFDHEEPLKIKFDDTQDVTHVADPPRRCFRPLLKVIAVTLKGPKGAVDTWALLDDGSTATFIDSEIAKKIGVTGSRSQVHLKCVGGLSKHSTVEFVDFSIKGVTSNSSHIVHRARSIPNLGISKQTLRHCDLNFDHLKDLNNVLCFENAQPMVIIGVDNWHLTLPLEVRRGTKSQPVACRTLLGWVVFGFSTSRSVAVNFIEHDVLHVEEQESTNFDNVLHVRQQENTDLDFLIKDYFRLDSLGISNIEYIGEDNARAVKVLNDTTRRLDSGRFETGLIWRDDNLNPPNNYSVALSRYKLLERKFIKDPVYAQAYKANIQSVIDKGYAELCTEPPQGITWYLPHFGVMHPQKRKLRVVHDAASVCQGVSLNSLLLSGPDLLQPLLAILMRFREGRIALNGDIKEMFPQTKIRVEDRDAQRFLWRSTPTEPIKEYRMSSMVFGATSSPFTALFLKNRNALEYRNSFPAACDAIINDHYMDDYLGSVDSVGEAMQLAADIQEVHSRACLQMCSWVSNSDEALRLIPSEFRASSIQQIGLVNPLNQFSPDVRVLGVSWNVINDTLCFTRALPPSLQKLTKRAVLSKLMSVYDPLGLLAPVVIKGRILFQQIWRSGVGWDDVLPPPIASKWENWLLDLRETSNISVPRCYTTQIDPVERQLHLFSDASEHAFSCVAYWRFTSQDGTIKLALIGGKARLAPLKPVSIPRLELQGALIAARLAKYICDAHKHKPTQSFFWCDSLTVLKWLRSDARSFKAFVAYRVGEISELTDLRSWRYVPSAMNVADDATKPNSKLQISRWLSGPEFLLSNSERWPREPPSSSKLQSLDERKNNDFVAQISDSSSQSSLPAQSGLVTETRDLIVADYTRFSKWMRVVRATARIRFCASKFISILRPVNLPNPNSLTASNIFTAERDLLLKSQSESFPKEIECLRQSLPFPKRSRLAQLALRLDSDGFIRLASRILAARDIPPNRDLQPIILDGRHPIVRLLLLHLHEKHAHGNCELVVNQMRLRFHVLHLRPSVKYVAHRCQTCKIRKATPMVPPFGDLPAGRLAHHKRPFSHVGVDYFGPVNVTAGRRRVKRYVALFTCLTVRAVHLEIAENLTTDSALMALRRFIARRGCPICIYSDNGTAFVGAARKLEELYDFAANHNIQWKFITPAAPFMGGCWERLVRSVKTALSVTLLERAPREEILYTLLMEAEAIINSRPLTHVPVGPDDDEALTPYHFLIGGPSGDHQLRTLCDSDLCRRADYKKGRTTFGSVGRKKYFLVLRQEERGPRKQLALVTLY